MKKKLIEHAILETQKCLTHFWQNDYNYAISRLHENVMWIGALEEEFFYGIESVKKQLHDCGSTNPHCHLLLQEFLCAHHNSSICLVVGRYTVGTDEKSEEIIKEQQRCSFLWVKEKEDMKIIHMHISSPIGYLEPSELFPHKIGRMTYQYIHDLISEQKFNEEVIKVRNTNGHIRFIPLDEIEYIEASNHNTLLHTFDGTIEVRANWKEIYQQLEKTFIKVHRSYAVNLKYIKEVRESEIEMTSKSLVPIPLKKRKGISLLLSTKALAQTIE